jgi:hypothetical protein
MCPSTYSPDKSQRPNEPDRRQCGQHRPSEAMLCHKSHPLEGLATLGVTARSIEEGVLQQEGIVCMTTTGDPKEPRRDFWDGAKSMVTLLAALVAAATSTYAAFEHERSDAREKLFDRQITACVDWLDEVDRFNVAVLPFVASHPRFAPPPEKIYNSTYDISEESDSAVHKLHIVSVIYPGDIGASADSLALEVVNLKDDARIMAGGGPQDIDVQNLYSKIVSDQVNLASRCRVYTRKYAGFS